MVDLAGEHPHLARSAQTFLAIALDIDVCSAQDLQYRPIRRDLEYDAGVFQLDFERLLLRGIKLAGSRHEMLDAQRVLGPPAQHDSIA